MSKKKGRPRKWERKQHKEDQKTDQQIAAVLAMYGHADISELSPWDALDMIACDGEGWVATLAGLVYATEVMRAAEETARRQAVTP